MNKIMVGIVAVFIQLVLGSSAYKRIEAEVLRWADRKIKGAFKREGVISNVEAFKLGKAEWAIRIAVELALGKYVNYDATRQPTESDIKQV